MNMSNAILLDNVSHLYGGKKVLKNISMEVNVGEIFGLLGPSGAGKTTVMKILTGQIGQSEGKAVLLDMECHCLPPAIYRQIGVMMDNLGLYERLSVYDNLRFFAALQNIPKGRIEEVLRAVGLWEERIIC